MDSSSITTSSPAAAALAATVHLRPSPIEAGDDSLSGGLGTDGALAVKDAHAIAPVASLATFDEISLSGFLSAFKAGDKIDLDGPVWYNGTGKINALDKDHVKFSFSGKIGTGAISLERKSANTFSVTKTVDGDTQTFAMRATRHGDQLVFVDTANPGKTLTLTRDGGTVSLTPKGMGGDHTIDISKQ